MGLVPALDREEPEILKIYETIIAETGKRGQKAGIHCMKTDYARRMHSMGFSMVTIMNDSGILLTAARAAVSAVRGT
jgi:4-hydroxy-2-oxoheptanedioate aldolase